MARPQTEEYKLAITKLAQWITGRKQANQYITHRQYIDYVFYLEREFGIKSLANNISKTYSRVFKIDPESKFYIDYIGG